MLVENVYSQEPKGHWLQWDEGGGGPTEQTARWSLSGTSSISYRTESHVWCVESFQLVTESPHRKMRTCGLLCCKPRRTSLSCTPSWTSWRTCTPTRKLNIKGEAVSLSSAHVCWRKIGSGFRYDISGTCGLYFFTEKRMNWRGWLWNTSRIPIRFRFSSKCFTW